MLVNTPKQNSIENSTLLKNVISIEMTD